MPANTAFSGHIVRRHALDMALYASVLPAMRIYPVSEKGLSDKRVVLTKESG